MSGAVNKVDMSLDDIIKLNKKTKKGISPLNRTQQGNARNTRKGSTLKKFNNDKIPGRYSGVNRKPGAGGVTKNNNNAILQKKRMNALKKLREAKQALALIDAKKRTYGKLRNQPQRRLPQQNNRQQNNNRNFNNTLSPNQSQNTNKRPRINRNYGSQASLNQLNNPMKKRKFTASTISLGPVGSTNKGGYRGQSRNNQNTNTRRQPRQNGQNRWNKQSIDNGLTVQVNNNRIKQNNRNRRNNNNTFNTRNLKVQQGKHRNYEFDTNVFANVGTSIPLNDRFSSKGQKQYQGNKGSRQVYY